MEHRIEMPELEECIICYEETVTFMNFPCKHKVCPVCFPKLHQCPLCQTELQKRIQRPTERDPRCETCTLCCSIFFITAFCIWCLKMTRTI